MKWSLKAAFGLVASLGCARLGVRVSPTHYQLGHQSGHCGVLRAHCGAYAGLDSREASGSRRTDRTSPPHPQSASSFAIVWSFEVRAATAAAAVRRVFPSQPHPSRPISWRAN